MQAASCWVRPAVETLCSPEAWRKQVGAINLSPILLPVLEIKPLSESKQPTDGLMDEPAGLGLAAALPLLSLGAGLTGAHSRGLAESVWAESDGS
jgi:hypothetical protein